MYRCMKFMRHWLLFTLTVTAIFITGCGIRGGENSLPWISAEALPTAESVQLAERQNTNTAENSYPNPPTQPSNAPTADTGYPYPGQANPTKVPGDSSYPVPQATQSADGYPVATARPAVTRDPGYPVQATATPRPQSTNTATRPAPTATIVVVIPIQGTPTAVGGYPIQPTTPIGDGYPDPQSPTVTATKVAPTANPATNTPTANTPTPSPTASAVTAATATTFATLPPIIVSTATSEPIAAPTNTPPAATATVVPPATSLPTLIPTATAQPTASPTALPTPTLTPPPIALPTQAPTPAPTATTIPSQEIMLVAHRILPGENLFSIGRFYGVSVQKLITVNNIPNAGLIYAGTEIKIPLPAGSVLPKPDLAEKTTVDHEVKSGESLGYLSVLYDISMNELIETNGIHDPDIIFIGSVLKIPFPDGSVAVAHSPVLQTIDHVVRPGETLSGLSAFYDVSQNDLLSLNTIPNPDLILTGSVIQVPASISAEDRNNLNAGEPNANSIEGTNANTTESGNAVHLVKSGDTLLGIAAFYNVSIFDLSRLNGIEVDAFVLTGQHLALPANASVQTRAISDTIVELLEDADNSAESAGSLQLPDAKGKIYMIVDGSLVRVDANLGILEVVVAVEPIVDGMGAIPFGRYAGTGPTILGSRAVIDFRLNESGDRIVVLRAWESSERIAYDIQLVDLSSGEQTLLAENLSRVLDIEWSQDEQWVSYIEVTSDTESGVYALSTIDENYNTYIGSCQRKRNQAFDVNCQGLSLDNSADSVLYVDGRGMWRATFDGFAPILITNYDASGALMYEPVEWSPDGRYLLMWGGYIEGGQRFIYDSATDRVAPVPFSSAYIYISAVSWLENDRLLVLSPSVPGSGQRPVASVFAVNGESETLLSLERDITLPTVSDYQNEQNSFPGVQVWSQGRFMDQSGSFAIVSTDDRESGVYLLNLDDSTVKRLNGLPQVTAENYVREVIWSPDGSGALLVYSSGQDMNRVYWISADTATPIELPLSEAVCCLQWK